MQFDNNKKSPIAEALRAAGYVPLPRLWVQAKDIPEIHKIANKYGNDVNTIRGEVYSREGIASPKADPREDRNAAWAAYEQHKGRI